MKEGDYIKVENLTLLRMGVTILGQVLPGAKQGIPTAEYRQMMELLRKLRDGASKATLEPKSEK